MHVVFLLRSALLQARPHKVMRLCAELERAGGSWSHIDFADMQVVVSEGHIHILHHGVPFSRSSLIYWAHEWGDAEAFMMMEALDDAGYPLFMSPRMPRADKVTQALMFGRAGLAVPPTWIVSLPAHVPTSLPFPLILKGRYGSRGEKVAWVSSLADVVSVAQTFAIPEGEPFVLQAPVLPLGADVRAFVVDSQVVAAMTRQAPSADFRSNISLGATGIPTSLSPDETALVIAAHRLFQTPVSGVDFMRSAQGPILLEVNLWPGLQGIEAATGVNVAASMVDYMVLKASNRV